MPDVAILDAVTEGVPPNVTAMTGIDAFGACDWGPAARAQRRRFTDSGDWRGSDDWQIAAESRRFGHDHSGAYENILASLYGGMAFSESAGLGLCHAMARHQRGSAAYSHGGPTPCCCQQSWGFNRIVCRERFSQIGRALAIRNRTIAIPIAAVCELIAESGTEQSGCDAGAKPNTTARGRRSRAGGLLSASNPRTPHRHELSTCTRLRVMPWKPDRCSHRHRQ